jgi:hypothetical protein
MKPITNNICEDWGWYYDTELNCYINVHINIYHTKSVNKSYLIEKKNNYYEQICKDNQILNYKKNEEKSNNEKELIYDIDSITLIGCILFTLTVLLFKSLN